MDVRYRAAASLDASVLAPMNAQLIRDEGHRNSMTMPQLTERMSEWLKTEYQAFVFEIEGKTIGYALYLVEPEYIYCGSYSFNRKCGAEASHAGRLNGCVKTRGASAHACALTSSLAIIPPSNSGALSASRTIV